MKRTNIAEIGVIGIFFLMLTGYALFIYPFEKINKKLNREGKEKQLKYAPKLEKS